MKILGLLAFAMIVTLNNQKCNNETITDLGFDTSYIANVSNFKNIDAKGIASINFTQGNEFHLVVSGQKKLVDNLALWVNDGTLYIDDKKNIHANGFQHLTIDITAPDINYLHMGGVGSFQCNSDFIVEHNLKIYLDGVGHVKFNDVFCKNMDIISGGVGALDFNQVNCGNVYVNQSGVGSSKIHNLAAKDVDINSSGVGSVSVYTECKSINVNASGVGSVTVSGTTDNYSVRKSGIGGVNTQGLKMN